MSMFDWINNHALLCTHIYDAMVLYLIMSDYYYLILAALPRALLSRCIAELSEWGSGMTWGGGPFCVPAHANPEFSLFLCDFGITDGGARVRSCVLEYGVLRAELGFVHQDTE